MPVRMSIPRPGSTIEVEKAMQGMIKQDEARAVFPTSYGYFNPSVLKVAPHHKLGLKRHPDASAE